MDVTHSHSAPKRSDAATTAGNSSAGDAEHQWESLLDNNSEGIQDVKKKEEKKGFYKSEEVLLCSG